MSDIDPDGLLRMLAANPPLKAPFLYATDDEAATNALSHMLVQVQAALLAETHPDIEFDSLAYVAITNDVAETVRNLETHLGLVLESARREIDGVPVFNVFVNARAYLFITDRVVKGLRGMGQLSFAAASEWVRRGLAEVGSTAHLITRLGEDPAMLSLDGISAEFFRLARTAWGSYAMHRMAYAKPFSTDEVFEHLTRTITFERQLIVDAMDSYAVTPDVEFLRSQLQQRSGFLANSMAGALGQLHAAGLKLSEAHPTIHAQIAVEGFLGFWLGLERDLNKMWDRQAVWTGRTDFDELSALFIAFLEQLGLKLNVDDAGRLHPTFASAGVRTLQ